MHNLFNKYLFLGGIDTAQRQFGGVSGDKEAIEGASAEEIRQMTSIDAVGGRGSRFFDGSMDSNDWEVNFEAVVKGFLYVTLTYRDLLM